MYCISDFLKFRSYLFMDAGRVLSDSEYGLKVTGTAQDPSASPLPPPTELMADAGAGISLSFNIPDNYGKPRGFVLRYEVPFWLSEPGGKRCVRFSLPLRVRSGNFVLIYPEFEPCLYDRFYYFCLQVLRSPAQPADGSL